MQKNVRLALIFAAALFGCIGSATGGSQSNYPPRCPEASYYRPMWSVDGTSIYYELSTYLPTPTAGRGAGDGLRAIDTDGKNDRLLDQWTSPGQLSPDGKMLLYISSSFYVSGAIDYDILDLATLKTRKLLTDRGNPSWSPDSQWILSASSRDGSSLTKTNAITGQSINLTDGKSRDIQPLWSPDGKTILFQSDRDNDFNSIYMMDADGKAITHVKIAAPTACAAPQKYGGDFLLSTLPDGKTLVSRYECDYHSRLRTLSLDGTEVNDLSRLVGDISESVSDNIQAKWSPDGTKVLFIRGRDLKLAVADADGTHERVLRDSSIYYFAWSPDSSRVAFVDKDSAWMDEIFTIRPDGTDLQQVTRNSYTGEVCP